MKSEKLIKLAVLSIISFSSISFSGCSGLMRSPTDNIAAINLSKTDIRIADKVPIRVMVSNPWNHQLEFRYTADRGQIIANNTGSTAIYYAPFTGGPDTIRVSIFNRTDNINLPIITQQVFVQGESMAYVELSNTGSQLGDYENGLIKVASVRGSTQVKEIGWGRTPTISPDGRYIAYVYYPGDGTSQIMVKDPVGNETNITNHMSFNIDPAWSPIGNDGNLYLVFSSDRISSNSGTIDFGNGSGVGNVVSGHGEKYHLWRIHVNGYDLRQITNTAGNDFQPSWSPDGRSIAFSSTFDSNNRQSNQYRNLWVLDVQTGKQTQYTYETTPNKGAFNPQWSPDGQKIVYTRKYQFRQLTNLENFQKIWMINFGLNSSGFGQIVSRAFDANIVEDFPSWTPDGRTITYVRARGTDLSVVSIDVGTVSGIRGSFSEPIEEGGITNVTEARWARQRANNFFGGTPIGNNPFVPNPTLPNQPSIPTM